MSFWLVAIGGLIFAYVGLRIGFYMVWQSLFNLLVAIYVGVMFTPWLIDHLPEMELSGYGYAVSIILLASLLFLILQAITACYLTGISEVQFPRIFETFGAGILGFVLGYFLFAFIIFVLYLLPISHSEQAKQHVFRSRPITALNSINKACNWVGTISLQYHDNTVEKTIDWLLFSVTHSDTSTENREWKNKGGWKEGPETDSR
ncbi:MAG: CvpA family protein [Sedimentisphaerales bacterium]|nr:CvpA family protein [Sedimentisphaerales bacterium]